jgi:hypothetical protein
MRPRVSWLRSAKSAFQQLRRNFRIDTMKGCSWLAPFELKREFDQLDLTKEELLSAPRLVSLPS